MLRFVIIQYLATQNRHVKRIELLRHLWSLNFDVSDRLMRKEIEEAVRGGELIESSEKGYKMINTEEDLSRAVDYLDRKASSIAIRKNTLIQSWNNKQLKQTDNQLLLL
jgi:hypothetical protein